MVNSLLEKLGIAGKIVEGTDEKRDEINERHLDMVALAIEGLLGMLVKRRKINYSIYFLFLAADVQIKKGDDYQHGSITQYEYYPRGIETMLDTMQSKILRLRSLIEKFKETGALPINEGLDDSLLDLINTASFALSFLHGKMDGQPGDVDMFNRKLEYGSLGLGNKNREMP